jgi:hypothetical protein
MTLIGTVRRRRRHATPSDVIVVKKSYTVSPRTGLHKQVHGRRSHRYEYGSAYIIIGTCVGGSRCNRWNQCGGHWRRRKRRFKQARTETPRGQTESTDRNVIDFISGGPPSHRRLQATRSIVVASFQDQIIAMSKSAKAHIDAVSVLRSPRTVNQTIPWEVKIKREGTKAIALMRTTVKLCGTTGSHLEKV